MKYIFYSYCFYILLLCDSMSNPWPPSQAEIDRIKFLRQMELNLKEQARRKEQKIAVLKEENALAKYILNSYENQKGTAAT